MTGSKLQLYNGIMLLCTFFGCRLCWGSYQSVRVFYDVYRAITAGELTLHDPELGKKLQDKDGNIRLFRPDKNMARLNKSSARIALPTFDPDALIELIGKFVKEDERFVPE